jgi:PAS domain S-box-containing protein
MNKLRGIGRLESTFIMIYIFSVLISAFTIHYVWQRNRATIDKHALMRAETIAISLNGEALTQLRAIPEDAGTAAYNSIKLRLSKLLEKYKDVSFAYLFAEREGRIYFMVDSEPEGSEDMSPPGQEYTEAQDQDRQPFLDGLPLITEPASDRWGTWITCFIPIKDRSGKVIAVFGMDYDAKNFYLDAKFHTGMACVIIVLIFLLLFAFHRIIRETVMLKEEQGKTLIANEKLQKSEAHLNTIISNTPAIIYSYVLQEDGTTKLTYINENVKNVLGFTAQDYLESPRLWQSCVHSEDIGKLADKFTARNSTFEYRIRDNKDRYHWVIDQQKVLKNADGSIGIIGTWWDITDRKHAEQALMKSENTKIAILKAIPDLLFVFDQNGNFLESFTNEESKLLLPWEDVAGKNISNFFPSEVADKAIEAFKESLHNNRLVQFYYSVENNGKTEYFEARIVPASNVTVLSIVRDITERKMAEEALIVAKESAEENNRLKSSFLSNMSHELRTPLNGILGFSELLKEQLQDKENRELVDLILTAGNRLLNTLNLLLDLSRIEANKQDLKLETIDLNLLLKEIVKQFVLSASEKGLNLYHTTDSPELFVCTDKYILGHILIELIGNAIKYTDYGTINVHITNLEFKNAPHIGIVVSDTGIGIPLEYQETVFDAFRQVSEGWGRSYEGSGLGLSLSKNTPVC